jgi:hypothetical protein
MRETEHGHIAAAVAGIDHMIEGNVPLLAGHILLDMCQCARPCQVEALQRARM